MKLDPKHKKAAAYSLVEVMMALFVFSLVALGMTAAVMQSQKIAVSNALRSTAHNVVQGYLEQIKSLPTTELDKAVANPTISPLPTITLDPTAVNTNPGDIEVADPLFIGQANAKNVVIDLQEDDPENPVTMTMEVNITPSVTDLNDSATYGADAVPAYEVILDFTYEVRHVRGTDTHAGSLRAIIATV